MSENVRYIIIIAVLILIALFPALTRFPSSLMP